MLNNQENKKTEKKFQIGDKVDFVNDYGVVFENKTIVGFQNDFYGKSDEPIRYFIEPTDTPWYSNSADNLYPMGTYKKPDLNIELNNNSIAKYKEVDFWGNKLYEIKELSILAVMIEGSLYSISENEEPINQLNKEWQLIIGEVA